MLTRPDGNDMTCDVTLQAMMELGATVCKPVNPSCSCCPISSICAAAKEVAAYAAAGGGGCLDMEDAPKVTDYPEKVLLHSTYFN
jgi:A/G-specific adenine glycosylase